MSDDAPSRVMPMATDIAGMLDVMHSMLLDRDRRDKELAEERRLLAAERELDHKRQEAELAEERRRYKEESLR